MLRQRHNYWDAIRGNLCCRINVFSSIIFSFPNCHHWGWLVSSAVVFLGRCLFEILQTKICSRTTGSYFCSDTTERPSETGLFLNSRNGCLRILSQLISVLYRLQINTFIFVFLFFLFFNIITQYPFSFPVKVSHTGSHYPVAPVWNLTSESMSPWQLLMIYVCQVSQWHQPTDSSFILEFRHLRLKTFKSNSKGSKNHISH